MECRGRLLPSSLDRIRHHGLIAFAAFARGGQAQSAGVDAPLTPTDPTILPRAIRLVEYLEAVRGLREQPIRDLAEYRDKRWWAADIPIHPSCVVTATGEEPWLRVSKASVPPPPPVPPTVIPYLQAGATDPEREPALVDDISEIFDGEYEELEDLRGQLDAYVSGARPRAVRRSLRAAAAAAARLGDDRDCLG
jgi:hypothetical protein